MAKSQIFQGAEDEVKALTLALNQAGATADKLAMSLDQKVSIIDDSSVKSLSQMNKIVVDLQKVLQQKVKIEKELEKLQKRKIALDKKTKKSLTDAEKLEVKINKARQKGNKEIQKRRNELSKVNKETKNAVIIEEQLGIEYENVEEALEELNIETIKQAQTIKEATEQNKALRLVVRELNADIPEQAEAMAQLNAIIDSNTSVIKGNSDEFVQNKINIGNYKEDILSALDSTGAFSSGVQNALGSVFDFSSGLKEMDRGLENLGRRLGVGEKNLKKFRRSAKVAGSILTGVLAIGATAVASAFSTSQEKALQLEVFLAQLQNTALGLVSALGVLGDDLIKVFVSIPKQISLSLKLLQIDVFKAIGKDVTELRKETNKLEKELKNVDFSDTSKAFKDATTNILASNKALENNIRLRFQLEEQQRRQAIVIAQTAKQEAILQGVVDDDTASLKERIEASKELEKVTLSRLRLQEQQAQKSRQIAENQIQVELLRAGISGVSTQNAINNAKFRDKLSKETLDAFKDAKVAEIEAETETAEKIKAIQIEKNKTLQDLFEQNLDFNIDVAERNRNILIAQFEDVTNNLEDRATAFGKLSGQLEKDLKNQIGTFEEFNKNLDFEISTNDGDLALFVNDTKLALDNTVELNKQLQDLGLSEIEINRLKEVITDGKDASKEIKQLKKEFELLINVTKGEKEGELLISEEDLQKTRELNQELQDLLNQNLSADEFEKQSQAIIDKQDELNEQILLKQKENRINAIDEELKLVEKGSEKAIELEIEKNEILKELADIELQNTKEAIDKKAKAQEEANAKEIEDKKQLESELRKIGEKGLDLYFDNLKKRSEARIKDLQDEIKEGNTRQDELRKQANAGNTLAAESLAKEEELERERTRKIEEEKRKQVRNEMLLALLKVLSSTAGQPNGEAKALTAIKALIANVKSLPTFDVGTDNTGKTGRGVDGKGGFHAVLHPNEMVMNSDQTSELAKHGYKTRDSILNLVKSTNKLKTPSQVVVDNTIVVNELREVKDAIKSLKLEQNDVNYDVMENIIEYYNRKGNRAVTRRRKL